MSKTIFYEKSSYDKLSTSDKYTFYLSLQSQGNQAALDHFFSNITLKEKKEIKQCQMLAKEKEKKESDETKNPLFDTPC